MPILSKFFDWNRATLEDQCAEFGRLDTVFDTPKASPLHHDNRCPIHGWDTRSRRWVK